MVVQKKRVGHVGCWLKPDTYRRFVSKAHEYGGNTAVMSVLIEAWLNGSVTLEKPQAVKLKGE